MHKILLQRRKEYQNVVKPSKNGKTYKIEDSTVGDWVVQDEQGNEIFRCYVLENIGPSTDTPQQDKRIVARTYKLFEAPSGVCLPAKYKGKALSLKTDELPSFAGRGIRIHIGNYPQDTEGCPLLGLVDNKNGTIGGSTGAVEKFYDLVYKIGIENFELEVREIQ